MPSKGTDPELLRRAERAWGFVSGGPCGIDHPLINPLALPAAEWAKLGCRRALVTVTGLDTMRDRGRRYVEALRGSAWAGEEAALYETEGERHVYFIDKSGAGGEKARKEMEAVASFISDRIRWAAPICVVHQAMLLLLSSEPLLNAGFRRTPGLAHTVPHLPKALFSFTSPFGVLKNQLEWRKSIWLTH